MSKLTYSTTLFFLFLISSIFSNNASADVLVSCTWNVTGSGYGLQYQACVSGSTTIATRTMQGPPPSGPYTTCSSAGLTVTAGYTYTGTCSSPTFYKISSSSSASASSSSLDSKAKYYQYDSLGRLRKVTDAINGDRSYDYDAAGNRKNVNVKH